MRLDYVHPPRSWQRGDPLDKLLGADDLSPTLAEAIASRLAGGERHTHPKAGTCQTCADAAADAVLRYVETTTRVMASDALDPDTHGRAQRTMKAMPYLGSGSGSGGLRLVGDLLAHPTYPTVEDLLTDLDTIRRRLAAVVERDDAREAELHRYRKWHEATVAIATEAVEVFNRLDPATIDEAGS